MPISSFCSTGSGGTPSRANVGDYFGGTIPWVKSGELREDVILDTEEKITALAIKESSAKLVPKGALLIAMYGATIGRIAELGVEGTTNQAVCHIVPDENVADKRYLYYGLLFKVPELIAQGAGGAQPNINQQIIRDTQIPLPPLPEQKRIAAILDKANFIRRKRQEAIRLTEELLRSAFLDMFGDPVTNPKGWDTCCLGDVVQKIESGWSPVCEEGQAEENEWGVLKLGAVTTCRYLDNESKALPVGIGPRPDLEVKAGDLLFTRKNTYDLVAASVLVYSTRPKLMLSDLIFRLKLKDDSAVISEYLWALLSSTGKRKQIQSLAGGSSGSMPNISKSKLMEQMIEVPPMALQKKYAKILHCNYRIRNKLEATAQSSSTLFNSLLQMAFKGVL